MTRSHQRDDGAIAILVAVLSVVLFGFGALVVDLGIARDSKQQAQDSADAASLAGAADLTKCTSRRCTAAVTAIKSSANENFRVNGAPPLDWARCQAAPATQYPQWTWRQRRSGTQCIAFGWPRPPGTVSGPPAVVFVALPPRKSPSILGGIIGYKGLKISGSAVAGLVNNPVKGCALCVLDSLRPDGGSLQVLGGGSLYADNADVSAASLGTVSVTPASSGLYFTQPLPAAIGSVVFNPSPVVTGQSVSDPFASGVGGGPAATNSAPGAGTDFVCDNETIPPGTYGALSVPGGSICQLATGVYEFNKDVTVAGQLLGTGSGVQATISLRSGASLTVAPSGRVAIPVHETSSPEVVYADGGSIDVAGSLDVNGDVDVLAGDIKNTGIMTVHGHVYAPAGHLTVSPGIASITGTTVVRELMVGPAGVVTVDSPGTSAPQQARPDVALVR
ncbi:MAG: pilus assembly protein TadG-related protein [Actinomycetes bacterium]